MAVEFGLALTPGSRRGQAAGQWLDDLDASLTPLSGQFQSLWMSDHFFWDDAPTHEAWTTISYLAARYPQFTVAPSVLGQNYRNPALLAKMGASLHILSGGRFIMGIGAGWKEDEYVAYGYPYPSAKVRLEQLEDTLAILKALWTEPGNVTYQGKHYQVIDALCEPKPVPAPLIVVGGGGSKTMRLTAKYADWWNHSDVDIATYKERMAILDQHCATLGRDPATLRRTWFGRLSVGKSAEAAKEQALALGFGHHVGWSMDGAFIGTAQQIVDSIAPFIEIGVDYFMFEIIGLPDPDVIGLVVEDVLPKLR